MWQKLIRRLRRWRWGLLDPSFGRIARYLVRGGRTAAQPCELDAKALQGEIGAIEPVALMLPSTRQHTNGIPHIVFQTWKSRVDIPINYRYWRKTFIDNNPGFECILWDDADNRACITRDFAWFLPVYDRYPKEIFRADAIRPFFLLANGGVYADMDTQCLTPLERSLATTGDVLLGRMGADPDFDHSIPNAIMASKPRQLFWALVIAMMIERANDADPAAMRAVGPETFTGPILLKHAADFYRAETEDRVRERAAPVIAALSDDMRNALHAGRLEILQPDAWYPVDWTNPFHRMLRKRLTTKRVVLASKDARELFPSSTLVTYWSHSW